MYKKTSHNKICTICKKEFTHKDIRKLCCSDECYAVRNKKVCKNYQIKKPKTKMACKQCGAECNRNTRGVFVNCLIEIRPLTRFSIYLIHKWTVEGMTIKEISEMLDRPERQVVEGLDMKLTKNELLLIKRYKNN